VASAADALVSFSPDGARFGALAVGALAIDAVAIGARVIGRPAIGRARLTDVEIDRLVVRRFSGPR